MFVCAGVCVCAFERACLRACVRLKKFETSVYMVFVLCVCVCVQVCVCWRALVKPFVCVRVDVGVSTTAFVVCVLRVSVRVC